VLQTARRRFPGRRLVVVFQPHQFQRTLCLLSQFAEALAAADRVLVTDIYGARESDAIMAAVSAADLVDAVAARGCRAVAAGGVAGLADSFAGRRDDGDGDVVLVLGAGDVDQAVGGIVARL
jgi:UDP-N-acetylmuramate--alanine ligase